MSVRDVVVTGTSTGIGFAIARGLVARGARVFGSVRREEDAARLRGALGDRFVPLTMDVTNEAEVARAASLVRDALRESLLGGLVNNAGMAVAGPLLEQPIDHFEAQLRVNLTGVLRVTQAFAPLLGATPTRSGPPGRIVNITSLAGRIAAPFLGAYAASKHGLEALSDSLRRELMLYGVDVIVIAPGNVVTPIWDKAEGRVSDYACSPYGPSYEAFCRFLIDDAKTKGIDPERISDATWRALTTRSPRARYVILSGGLRNWTLPRLLPSRLVDRIMSRMFRLAQLSGP